MSQDTFPERKAITVHRCSIVRKLYCVARHTFSSFFLPRGGSQGTLRSAEADRRPPVWRDAEAEHRPLVQRIVAAVLCPKTHIRSAEAERRPTVPRDAGAEHRRPEQHPVSALLCPGTCFRSTQAGHHAPVQPGAKAVLCPEARFQQTLLPFPGNRESEATLFSGRTGARRLSWTPTGAVRRSA